MEYIQIIMIISRDLKYVYALILITTICNDIIVRIYENYISTRSNINYTNFLPRVRSAWIRGQNKWFSNPVYTLRPRWARPQKLLQTTVSIKKHVSYSTQLVNFHSLYCTSQQAILFESFNWYKLIKIWNFGIWQVHIKAIYYWMSVHHFCYQTNMQL